MPLAGGGIQGEGGPAPGWMLGPEEEGGDRKQHVNLEGKTGGDERKMGLFTLFKCFWK